MVNYIVYKVGQFIALSLPLKITYLLASSIASLHFLLSPRDRRAVKENLAVIFPDWPVSENRKICLRVFKNFAKYLVDFFRFSKLDREYIKKYVKIENIHYIDETLSKGKGGVILTAHIGNWELGGVVIALMGYPFWVVALPHKYKKVNDFFNKQRESKGIKVIPTGRAARQCLNVLKNNETVALVGDRNFNDKGVNIEFFGKPALFPPGPAAFSLKTNADIIPGFMLRNKDDTFTLKFEKPITFNLSGNENNDLIALTNRYKAIIENYVKQYPDQWYVFRRFWSR